MYPEKDGYEIFKDQKDEKGNLGILIKGKTTSHIEFYPEWGRGQWKAKTLDDAKQMAIDFSNEVS